MHVCLRQARGRKRRAHGSIGDGRLGPGAPNIFLGSAVQRVADKEKLNNTSNLGVNSSAAGRNATVNKNQTILASMSLTIYKYKMLYIMLGQYWNNIGTIG